ncbi:HAD-IA family hydrolase [Rudanella paleaurantiibacter]|uniref:HAD-IA family hydrolase n=1 Tax=Rudanella paleaurantiibacter TaxID=2614655 RepID=A0A7J5TZT5_9BACT|nr:HAD family phosphatase [Rudanella paleaurantiibacter]KAB7730927.1 HAD-IA family hydrolase [Rudanella paleaurantiibacter]
MLAAIFDMDGVIADTNPYHTIAWREYYRRNGKPLSDADFVKYVSGNHNKAIVAHLFDGQTLTDEEAYRLGDEKEALFRELYAPHIVPVPGLPDFLEALRQAGIKTAVGTSAPVENLDFVLEKLGLRDYFDVLLHEKLVQRPKPDPEIYSKAMEMLGVSPADSLIFEDSMTGIRAARASGARVVGVATTHTTDQLRAVSDYVIRDFTGLTPEGLMAAL